MTKTEMRLRLEQVEAVGSLLRLRARREKARSRSSIEELRRRRGDLTLRYARPTNSSASSSSSSGRRKSYSGAEILRGALGAEWAASFRSALESGEISATPATAAEYRRQFGRPLRSSQRQYAALAKGK